MISSDSPRLSSCQTRAWAMALFGVISAALWIGFAADTYFGSDGCFYFTIILDNATFTHIATSRAHAEYLTQWPLVLAVRSGITDLKLLEVFFGLGIWFPWVLGFFASLYATRERPQLIFFHLISLACLNLAGWCIIYGEHMVLLSIAWPIFFLAILRRPLSILEQLLAVVLLVAHLRLYEATIATGGLFAGLFAFRVWLARSPREKLVSAICALLALASVAIALYWIVCPRDAANRGSFLLSMGGSLGHPYPWVGVSFVVLSTIAWVTDHKKTLLAAWVVPVVIALVALGPAGIPGGISFSTRTLALTALPLLMILAAACSLSGFKLDRFWLRSSAAVIVGLSLLHVRHLQNWLEFRADFKAVLKSEEGFLRPEDHGQINHWSWTNTILSYVWAEGKVN